MSGNTLRFLSAFNPCFLISRVNLVNPFYLRLVVKGSNEPISDNGSDEGHAKNRKVVFVKK